MSLVLAPENLETAYEYLRSTLPFKRWSLPHADDIRFHITLDRNCDGYHTGYVGELDDHEIGISQARLGTTSKLLKILAHEMVHLHQRLRRTETANTEHNAEFHRLAKLVCRHHGYDYKEFV